MDKPQNPEELDKYLAEKKTQDEKPASLAAIIIWIILTIVSLVTGIIIIKWMKGLFGDSNNIWVDFIFVSIVLVVLAVSSFIIRRFLLTSNFFSAKDRSNFALFLEPLSLTPINKNDNNKLKYLNRVEIYVFISLFFLLLMLVVYLLQKAGILSAPLISI